MKKIGACLLMLTFAAQAAIISAQPSERPGPWFTLSIQEEPLSRQAGYSASDREVLVKYTNISDVTQQDNCVNAVWLYDMVVLRDGVPLEKRKKASEKAESKQSSDSGGTKIQAFEAKSCGRITRGINPGQTVKFTLWPSADYDMSEPGTYTITVKRETYPFDPAKSVTVWSNTITIVVPAAGNAPADK